MCFGFFNMFIMVLLLNLTSGLSPGVSVVHASTWVRLSFHASCCVGLSVVLGPNPTPSPGLQLFACLVVIWVVKRPHPTALSAA